MQVLSFQMGRETYCLRLLEVSEIVDRVEVFPLPRLQLPLEGIFQLRGKVVALMNLPLCFGLPPDCDVSEIALLAEPSQHLAVRIPGLLETVTIRSEKIEAAESDGGGAALEGIVYDDQQIYHVVSATKLLDLARRAVAQCESAPPAAGG